MRVRRTIDRTSRPRLVRCAAVVALLLGGIALPARAQRLQFRQITADDGLSGSWIPAILQDSRGFMWFSTAKGVNRYDGYDVVAYRHRDNDSTTIADNRPTTIYEDQQGSLWFGTGRGFSQYDRATERFVNHVVSSPAGNAGVDAILDAGGDGLWLGTTRGLYRYDLHTGTATPYSKAKESPVMGTEIHALHRDGTGKLWLGTGTKGVQLLDPRAGTVTSWTFDPANPRTLPLNDVRGFVEDPTGAMWVATYGGGLARLDRRDGTITRVQHDDHDPHSLTHNTILAFIPDRRRGFWIGTENGGLDYYDPTTARFEHYRFDPNDPTALNSNSIWSLYQDAAGTMWVGTFAGGVNISKPNGDAIRRYTSVAGDQNSLSSNSVLSFAEDGRGGVWVATDGGGVDHLDRSSGHFARYTTKTSNIDADAALAVVVDQQQRLWVGTWAGGLNRLDPAHGRFIAYTTSNSHLPDNNIFSLLVARDGTLWVGTWNRGLARFDEARHDFERISIARPGGQDALIRHMSEASDGSLLLATDGAGLVVVDPRTGDKKFYGTPKGSAGTLHSDQVNAVLETEPGTLWIGTGGGLDRLDRASGVVTHFGESDGLPSDFVAGIEAGPDGQLWLSTDRGVARFDPLTRRTKVYTTSDGLQGNEFNMGSYFRSRDGALFFGGTKGFSILRPAQITQNKHLAPVVFTSFSIYNKPVAIGAKDSPLTSSIGTLDRLWLDHTQSVFSVQYAGLDYAAPEKNEYAYKLEGLDRDWNMVGHQRTATYTNIPPGSYLLHVKASNNDGVWNDVGASIAITIVPPVWQRWWFRGIVLILLGLLARVLYRAAGERRRNLETMNATLASAAERDRASQQHLERNVLEILAAMERFSEGDLSVQLETTGDDAIGNLRRGVNTAVANIRAMVQQVRDVLDATVRTSRDIHVNTERLAAGAEAQIDQALQVAGAAEQMAQTVTGNSQYVAAAAEMAQKSGHEAQEGGRIVRNTFSGMDQIVASVAASARTVQALGQSSAQIAAITRVIDEIATQTNLLALNSAIEAARAGEHGSAFAIVAAEMQALAEQTAKATKEIARVIRDNDRQVETAVHTMGLVTSQIESGRQLVDQAGGALDTIIANSERMLASIQQVRASSEEQAATTAHISENIETISRVTRSAAQGNQTIASAVDELSELIEDLQRRVSRFRLDGGVAGGSLPSARQPTRT